MTGGSSVVSFLGGEKPFQVDGLVHAQQIRAERDATHAANMSFYDLLARYNELVTKFNAEVAAHNLTKANGRARNAQLLQIAEQVPTAPCLTKTVEKYKDGSAKTKSRLFYEDQFRKEAASLGVSQAAIKAYLNI